MKRIILCIAIAVNGALLHGQSVGIGTTVPNSTALLHLNSTTRGLLIPTMTTAQRNAIASPAEGLIIYNISTNQLNQRQDGAWKFILNNDFWVGGGSGQMFNIGDNIGINTASPAERLDVWGNIRSNSSVIIDNTSAILQLRSGGVNTGFVQLSGDNLRLGTNAGNANGFVVMRFNGTDRISFNKDGDMYLDGRVRSMGRGEYDLLPLCYGKVGASGFIHKKTDNVTIAKQADGVFNVYSPTFSNSTVFLITMNQYSGGYYYDPVAEYIGPGHYRVIFMAEQSQTNNDAGFSFIAY